MRHKATTITNDDMSVAPLKNFSEICIRKGKIFIQENAFENVIFKMAAILFSLNVLLSKLV